MRLKIAKRYGGKNRTQRLLRCAVADVTSYAPPGLCFLRRGDHRFSYTHGCKRVSKNARAIRYGDLQTLLADRSYPAKDYIFTTRSVERIDCGCQVVLNKVGAAGQHGRISKQHQRVTFNQERIMAISNNCIDKLFRDARTHNAWVDKTVSDETLRELYDALKWA